MRFRSLSLLSTVLLLAGIAVALAYAERVIELKSALAGSGPAGVLALIALRFAWTLTTVPSAPVMVLSGMVYGPWLGTLYSTIGGILGAFATFQIGRTAGRHRVLRWSARHPRFRAAMHFVETHPAMCVLLVQTVPVFPLNLMNYGFGATPILLRTYLGVTGLVLLPGAALYAGLGDLLPVLASGERVSVQVVAWIAGFGLLTIALGVYAKRRSEFG